MADKLLSAGEAARMLGIDPKTLARMRKAGKVPYVQAVEGAHPRYWESDIEAMLGRLVAGVRQDGGQ